ncbi:MAG: hypothetical protein RR678_04370 [Lachnospiraceae bacterium]
METESKEYHNGRRNAIGDTLFCCIPVGIHKIMASTTIPHENWETAENVGKCKGDTISVKIKKLKISIENRAEVGYNSCKW